MLVIKPASSAPYQDLTPLLRHTPVDFELMSCVRSLVKGGKLFMEEPAKNLLQIPRHEPNREGHVPADGEEVALSLAFFWTLLKALDLPHSCSLEHILFYSLYHLARYPDRPPINSKRPFISRSNQQPTKLESTKQA